MRGSLVLLAALTLIPRLGSAQGNPVGLEFRVNTYATSAQRGPAVAADASGNFVVVWESLNQDGSNYGLFGQRYASGGVPLGPEFRVNTFTTNAQRLPSVAVAPSGAFVVVWQSATQDGNNLGVFGQRYAGTGAPLGLEFRVNTQTAGDQSAPAAAVDPSGSFVVVWNSNNQDGSSGGIFAQRYASSGALLGLEFRINTFTTGSQSAPSVAADSSGNFVVVWNSDAQDGSGAGVFGQRFASSGAPLGPEFRVNTYTPGFQGSAAAPAIDSSGNFVVVWESFLQDGDNFGVFGQRYASTGAPVGPEFPVNTHTTNFQVTPSIATDPSGNFVVVWQSSLQDGSGIGVFGRRYASNGVPLSLEFRVNSYTTGQQTEGSVAADALGNFLVVWQSDGQDGSAEGVFGQRFNQILPVELMRFGVE